MGLAIWLNNHSVKIAELDNQHKQLFEILNKLYTAIKKGYGREALNTIFCELIDYTQVHFTLEESYLQKYNFPDFELHKAEHNKLISMVNELKEKHNNGSIILTSEVLQFLINWVDNHIFREDKKYSEFLSSARLK